MKYESQAAVDAELRRDRIVLVSTNPDGSQRIFDAFKTSDERRAQRTAVEHIPVEEGMPDDPELAKVLEQIKSIGFGIAEV